MTRIRSKRQHHVSFEALEGRLALSTGVGTGMAAASLHVDTSSPKATISASFRGRVQVNGSKLTVTGLTGTIGKTRFSGYGTGTATGTQFAGGTVYLSNSTGSIVLSLGPTEGKAPRQKVSVKVVAVSHNYAQYAGATGTLTKWSVPARPNAIASFSGSFVA
jgi:hypothetical protein